MLTPSGGLALIGGQAGSGKTTFAIDAAFHLAGGVDWLGWKVPEPLRVLVIENEGPREPVAAVREARAKVKVRPRYAQPKQRHLQAVAESA